MLKYLTMIYGHNPMLILYSHNGEDENLRDTSDI